VIASSNPRLAQWLQPDVVVALLGQRRSTAVATTERGGGEAPTDEPLAVAPKGGGSVHIFRVDGVPLSGGAPPASTAAAAVTAATTTTTAFSSSVAANHPTLAPTGIVGRRRRPSVNITVDTTRAPSGDGRSRSAESSVGGRSEGSIGGSSGKSSSGAGPGLQTKFGAETAAATTGVSSVVNDKADARADTGADTGAGRGCSPFSATTDRVWTRPNVTFQNDPSHEARVGGGSLLVSTVSTDAATAMCDALFDETCVGRSVLRIPDFPSEQRLGSYQIGCVRCMRRHWFATLVRHRAKCGALR
jgi:hypothetical protein